jgi:hypothetical protein
MVTPGCPRLRIAITGFRIGWENVILFGGRVGPPVRVTMSQGGGALGTVALRYGVVGTQYDVPHAVCVVDAFTCPVYETVTGPDGVVIVPVAEPVFETVAEVQSVQKICAGTTRGSAPPSSAAATVQPNGRKTIRLPCI